MPTTSPDNIYYADTSTPYNDVTVSAAEAASVQAAFSTRAFKSYRWPNAGERNNQLGMDAGDQGYQIDTGSAWIYLGNGWLPNRVLVDEGYISTIDVSTVASNSLLTAVTFPAYAAATRVIFNISGTAGSGGGESRVAVVLTTTGGAIAGPTNQVYAPLNARASISQIFQLTLPSNTEATVGIRTSSTISASYTVNGSYRRLT